MATQHRKYILALDQGTTSSRAIVFTQEAKKKACVQKEFTQFFPKPGWVEHDAEEIFLSTLFAAKGAIEKAHIGPEHIAAVGIANQRETVVLWDKITGKPVSHAIVWQCRRTAHMAERLISDGLGPLIQEKTGLLPDAYFSATKIKWLFDTNQSLKQKAQDGTLLCGTIDSWLVWKLTGGRVHATDVTNASRTMLFNINTLEWDAELLSLFDIPPHILPTVCDSSFVYGYTSRDVCGFEAPIASCIGDQQASLFAQGCFASGEGKTTYGTGCFIMLSTGQKLVRSKHAMLSTIAWGRNKKVQYALEGSVFMGGATIKWLRDELHLISSAKECDTLAQSVQDTNGAVLVPAFTGLGSPYWDPYARGTLIGLTRGVTKAHICRAALEAIAYQVKDALLCMQEDAALAIKSLKVDGGASVSVPLMQFQADLLNIPLYRPKNVETTALGAAFLAGLCIGMWTSQKELPSHSAPDTIFMPEMGNAEREALYAEWKRAVERCRGWAL